MDWHATPHQKPSSHQQTAVLNEYRRPIYQTPDSRPRSDSTGAASPDAGRSSTPQALKTPTRARARSSATELCSPKEWAIETAATTGHVESFPRPTVGMIVNGTSQTRQSALYFGLDKDVQMMPDEPLILNHRQNYLGRFSGVGVEEAAWRFRQQRIAGQSSRRLQRSGEWSGRDHYTYPAESLRWLDSSHRPQVNNEMHFWNQNGGGMLPDQQTYSSDMYTGGDMTRPLPVMSPARPFPQQKGGNMGNYPCHRAIARGVYHENNGRLHRVGPRVGYCRPAIRQMAPPPPQHHYHHDYTNGREPSDQDVSNFGQCLVMNAASPTAMPGHIPQHAWDLISMMCLQMTNCGMPPMPQGPDNTEQPHPAQPAHPALQPRPQPLHGPDPIQRPCHPRHGPPATLSPRPESVPDAAQSKPVAKENGLFDPPPEGVNNGAARGSGSGSVRVRLPYVFPLKMPVSGLGSSPTK